MVYVFSFVYFISTLFSFSSTSRLILTVSIPGDNEYGCNDTIMPKIPTSVKRFPSNTHPKIAAEIGSNDESIEPCIAPMSLTPSI